MTKHFLKLSFFILTASLLFSNCATIFSGSSYPVSINTSPTGADVSITNKKGNEVYKGQTPASVKLSSGAGYFSKAEYKVKLSSPGYAEQIIPVNFKLNGWYFGNLLLGGVLGMLIIDPLTGAMWRLDSKTISINLNKSTTSVTAPTLQIIAINDVPESLKSHLLRVN